MMDTVTAGFYRHQRRHGIPARLSLKHARDMAKLHHAKQDGEIRFRWESDQDFEVDGFYGYDEPDQTRATDELRAKINSGEWLAEGCIAEVPNKCQHCGHDLDGWSVAASLWGIVHDGGGEYTRWVELDLAHEAGVI